MLRLDDVSSTLQSLIPIATLLLSLTIKVSTMLIQAARWKLSGAMYSMFVTYRKTCLNLVQSKPVLLSKNIGWSSIFQAFGILPLVQAAASKNFAEDPWKQTIAQADKLYNEHSYKKLHDLLIQYKDAENAEILWRLARATYEMAKVSSSPAQQKEMDYEAYEYVARALSLDPDNYAAHKWMFILLDKKTSYQGLKERISQSFVVKQHIQRACELNPRDGTSLHLLGYWCFSVAELPWYQRQIASTLFATPPVSSYQEALQYFLQAEAVEPNFYSMNLLLIGKTYLRLKDKDKAVHYLTRARDYPASSAEDGEAKKEAAKLLQSL